MKIIMSPSKEMNLDNMEKIPNTINSKYFYDHIKYLKSENIEFTNMNVFSKKAIKLYKGLAFRQLTNLDDEFYKNVIILSSLYGYSLGTDYISEYRLDYTTPQGRKYRKQFLEEINELLSKENIVYNLASNEFSKGVIHDNMINFEFLVKKGEEFKSISATSKKLRGLMVNYIKDSKFDDLEKFNLEGFKFDYFDKKTNTYVYKKV